MTNAFIELTDGSLTIILGSTILNKKLSDFTYPEIKEELSKPSIDWKRIEDLCTPVKGLEMYCKGSSKLTLDAETFQVFWDTGEGEPRELNKVLSEQLLRLWKDKKPVEYHCRFLERLEKNPSSRSVDELFLFLERNELPITEDGCFLAYKGVRKDYKDVHTGFFDNSVGQVLQMPRNKVDDERSNTCSYGFHAGRYDYAESFGDRLMVVKIDPADVVSVPYDYDNAKLRTCKYEVVGEIGGEDLKKEDVLKTSSAFELEDLIDFLLK